MAADHSGEPDPTKRPGASSGPIRSAGPVGVVLCGGASRRMGRDKASIGDPPWAHRVATALGAGGCVLVELQGGSADLATRDWAQVADLEPGGGPAPAVVQAAARHRGSAMVVAACDLPHLGPSSVLRLIETISDPVHQPGGSAVAYRIDGRANWSLFAMGPGSASRLAGMSTHEVAGRALRSLLEPQATFIDDPDRLEVTDIDEPPAGPPDGPPAGRGRAGSL